MLRVSLFLAERVGFLSLRSKDPVPGGGFKTPENSPPSVVGVLCLFRLPKPASFPKRHKKPALCAGFHGFWRRERDSNPRYSFPYTHFPGALLQPLGHLSSSEFRTRGIRNVGVKDTLLRSPCETHLIRTIVLPYCCTYNEHPLEY